MGGTKTGKKIIFVKGKGKDKIGRGKKYFKKRGVGVGVKREKSLPLFVDR